jgi:hypothetical protein
MVWRSHRRGYQYLIGHREPYSVDSQRTFRKNIPLPSSRSKNKPSKFWLPPASSWFLPGLIRGLRTLRYVLLKRLLFQRTTAITLFSTVIVRGLLTGSRVHSLVRHLRSYVLYWGWGTTQRAEPHRTSLRTAGVRVQIQTENLPNTRLRASP